MTNWDRPMARRSRHLPSGIFLGIVAAFILTGGLTWFLGEKVRLSVFLFVVIGWVISLCLHEYAHAVMALRGGDRGVIDRGYLTLNPMRYAHPVLSLLLPLAFVVMGGIGLPGGAVWVDEQSLRNRQARSLVSLAGPAANLILAVLLCVPFMFGVETADHLAFWSGVAFLAMLQLTACLLNLLPIPGVDGGNMLEPWLNYEWQRAFKQIAPWGIFVLFLMLWNPQINRWFFNLVYGVGGLIGLPDWLSGLGYGYFQFWA